MQMLVARSLIKEGMEQLCATAINMIYRQA